MHIIGFAVTFGAWAAEAAARRLLITPVMNYGIAISLVTGVALAAPWPDTDPNYPKLIVKLIILVVLGAVLGIGSARQKRTGQPVPVLFALVGALSLLAAGIAVLWN